MKSWLWVIIAIYILIDLGYVFIIIALAKNLREMRRNRKELEELNRGRGW